MCFTLIAKGGQFKVLFQYFFATVVPKTVYSFQVVISHKEGASSRLLMGVIIKNLTPN